MEGVSDQGSSRRGNPGLPHLVSNALTCPHELLSHSILAGSQGRRNLTPRLAVNFLDQDLQFVR